MKPLTKTVVRRTGGLAAQIASAEPKPAKVAKPAKPPPVANVANSAVANVANTRYGRWRDKNPELYRERQAGYMRKWRAKEKIRCPSPART